MKKLNGSLLLILATLLLTISACKKDKDDDGIGIGEDGCNASWTVNGTDYTREDMAGCFYVDNVLHLSESLTGTGFTLQIEPITSTGTYLVDDNLQNEDVVILIQLNDGTLIGPTVGCTVTVSELSSGKAKGTFSGDFHDLADVYMTPTFSITDGKFEANF